MSFGLNQKTIYEAVGVQLFAVTQNRTKQNQTEQNRTERNRIYGTMWIDGHLYTQYKWIRYSSFLPNKKRPLAPTAPNLSVFNSLWNKMFNLQMPIVL